MLFIKLIVRYYYIIDSVRRLGIRYKRDVKYKKRCEKKRADFASQIGAIDIDDLGYIDEAGVNNNIFKIAPHTVYFLIIAWIRFSQKTYALVLVLR
jgi:hypothetical protein